MKIVLGIDFGTCYSCVSYYNNGILQVIPNENGEMTSLSALYFDPYSYEILYGNVCKNINGAFNNLKRLIGKNLNDLDNDLAKFFINHKIVNDNFEIKYNNTINYFSITDLIVLYLVYLKRFSCEFLNEKVSSVIDIVITIPAYYSDHQREITKDCCIKAGFNVLRIINEPTAAALAYTYNKINDTSDTSDNKINENIEIASENVLVFDCGGGTTDLSFLNMDYSNDFYQVKNVIGNNFLGGEDLTQILVNYFKDKTSSLFKLTGYCENLKKELSYNLSSIMYIEDNPVSLSRLKFQDISKDFFNKIKILIRLIKNEVNNCTINKVIFVGGTTRIPYFKQIFKEIIGDSEICNDIDPDQTVSLGAAAQGALLLNLFEPNNKFSETLLLDIVPLSIGIETIGGIMVPIVSRNTVIPTSRTREFANSVGDDPEIDINVYQGERKLVCDNYFLANFKLKDVPLNDPGTLIIQVTFNIDSDSIITATAKMKDLKETESTIIIEKENVYQTSENLEKILIDAEEHKLFDSEIANKILLKIELYDSFKKLLGIFHEKRECILQDKSETENFLFSQLNVLFNETFYIIENYKDYSPKELREIKETFESEWHKLLFDHGAVFKNEDGLIIDTSGSTDIT